MNKLVIETFEQVYQSIFSTIRGRRNKYPLKHYLETIFYVLKTGIAWRDIKANLHWSTYYKKFKIWANNGLFKLMHISILELAKQTKKLTNHHIEQLFIDSTMVKNVKGVDLLGKNHYMKEINLATK